MDHRFEETVAAFERAWQSGQPPRVDAFLVSQSIEATPGHRNLLIELVLVDMERRWQIGAEGGAIDDALGSQPRLDDYMRELPSLLSVEELPAEVIVEEYRVRRLWGDRPNYDHYVSRFPRHRAVLAGLLRAVDEELIADDVPQAPNRTSRNAPAKSASHDPRAPLPFSDFCLQEHLGTGGMGKVYRARQISLDRPVAVKALLKSRQNDPAGVERFLQEGRILARLHHPNIVGIYGLGRFPGGGYFLVMDLIDGRDLAARLAAGPIGMDEIVRIASEVAVAIQHAHEKGVIHCDLKPGNVLLDRAGGVLVSDFGFAHLLSSNPPHVRSGGTIAYMAPEQFVSSPDAIGPATDVYGIGGILYHMLTGRPPIDVDHDSREVRPSVVEPTTRNELVPSELNRICVKCLAASSTDRYQSAAEVIAELRQVRLA